MIRSFADTLTEAVFHGTPRALTRRVPPGVVSRAARKLDLVNSAAALGDLGAFPGNRLEPLQGDLGGLHSIRVNDQWRIVFRWADGDAHDVRLVDYH